jgi:hypothetical protein
MMLRSSGAFLCPSPWLLIDLYARNKWDTWTPADEIGRDRPGRQVQAG